MILSTHVVVGSAIASLIPNHPIVGFSLAFVSHFLLDAIPHWDYKLKASVRSEENPLDADIAINRHFIRDLFCIGVYILIGIVIAIFVLGGASRLSTSAILAGTLGGIMPDVLQFVYMKIRRQPLISLQKFHLWIHAKKHINDPFSGIIRQIVIVATTFIALILIL